MDNSEYQRNDWKKWGMTVELRRFYDVMRRCGWTPAHDEVGGS
jgi:hypothetical protein